MLLALLFNAVVLSRFRRWLWRPAEIERGLSAGILLFPAAVLALILVFRHRLEVAAAVWGILAFGDGAAALVGTLAPRRPLPWNPRKTWAGTIAFAVFGSIATVLLLGWTLRHQAPSEAHSWAFLVCAGAGAALFAAGVESQPQELDDNVSVPLLTSLLLFGLLASEDYWTGELEPRSLLTGALVGLLINLTLAVAAFQARSIDASGGAAGIALGTLIYAFLGWRGFLVLGCFFLLGTVSTRLGYGAKAARRLAQEAGGRRGARHAVANAGVPALLAVFAATTAHGALLLPAFTAAFAAAASDTLESEIGQLWGGRPRLITTFERVEPGTDGAVSLAGSLAGLVGASLVAVLGWALGFYAPPVIAVVGVAGYLGSLVDSLAGATLEHRGLLDNEGVNVACTLAGGLIAAGWMSL